MKCTIYPRITVLFLGTSKFGLPGLVRVFELNEVDLMVTDGNTPMDILEEIQPAGVDV